MVWSRTKLGLGIVVAFCVVLLFVTLAVNTQMDPELNSNDFEQEEPFPLVQSPDEDTQPEEAYNVPAHASISDYYNGDLPCDLRPNRKNPYKNDFEPIETPYITNLLGETVLGDLQESSVTCDSQRNCLYRNVCFLQKPENGVFEFYGTTKNKTGYYPYRDYLSQNSFSWSYNVDKLTTKPPTNTNILHGRTLLMNPPFEFLPHSGHSTEVSYKIPAIRKSFPGAINYLAAAHNQKMFVWSEIQFKIAFPDTNWKVPPYFHLNKIPVNLRVCYEELLVPSHQHFGFPYTEAASSYRKNALKMCGITPREEYSTSKPEWVFFLERGHNRQMTNGKDLCMDLREKGYKVFRETVEDVKFCDAVNFVHNSDIIVTGHGSQSNILPFINPGSVVIFATGKNFIVTEWDTQIFFARGHMLELYELRENVWSVPPNPAYQGGDPTDPAALQKLVSMGWIESHSFEYRAPARHLNTEVHPENFAKFFEYAVSELYGRREPQECERPLVWPVSKAAGRDSNTPDLKMWKQFSWEQNYLPCEPPSNCVCCNDDSCSKLYRIARPF